MRITIVVTYSRPEYADLVKENLLSLDLGDNECDLLVMDDSKQMSWELAADVESRFKNVEVVNLDVAGRPRTSNIPQIRSRIAEVRNMSREYVGKTDFVFSFEDDTEVPKNALVKLLPNMSYTTDSPNSMGKVGLISGIQVGRHSRRILGAWHVDNYQFPNEGKSMGTKDIVTPLAEVDGTGMYCYLTPTHLYKSATYGWQEPFGPDVWYGLWLRTKGYVNYVDQSLICPHRSGDKTYVPDNETIKMRVWKKTSPNIPHGQWLNERIK